MHLSKVVRFLESGTEISGRENESSRPNTKKEALLERHEWSLGYAGRVQARRRPQLLVLAGGIDWNECMG